MNELEKVVDVWRGLKFTGVYSRKIKAQKKRLIIFSRSPSCLRCVGDSTAFRRSEDTFENKKSFLSSQPLR